MTHKALKSVVTLGTSLVVAATLLSGCSASAPAQNGGSSVSQSDIDKAMKTPTTLTFWTWVDVKDQVSRFEEKYPAIKVKVENVGQGAPHYQKIRTALKAGQGAADVVQMEYQYVSSFTQTKSLLDLAPYGAGKLSADYVPWVWKQVSRGNAVYSMPWDSGPMGNLYRKDIFAKANVSGSPATWNDYAAAAAQVKASTGSYISDLAPNDPGQLLGLLWQAGAKPFGYDGNKTVTIDVNSASTKKVLAYWQDLIQKNLVAVDPDFTDGWYQGLSSGKYAGWTAAAWGPLFLAGTAKNTSGLWQAAKLPQWAAGEDASGNWGGSSFAVLKSTKNPIAAAQLAQFLSHDPQSALDFATKQFLFPTLQKTLADPAFAEQKSDFYGGQKVNALFADISTTVDTKFEWLPFMDYAYSSYNDTLGKAVADKGDLSAGADAWQAALTSYAKQQGFTVSK